MNNIKNQSEDGWTLSVTYALIHAVIEIMTLMISSPIVSLGHLLERNCVTAINTIDK